jgi:hypothetical protein
MKRDDMGMRIDDIRKLATKYTKQDLQRMVQMGMIDAQKAVMAGMMIDRITQSAMKPPETTVAEDVLGGAPTTAQGQIPPDQMAQQAPPQMPPQMAAGGGLMGMMPRSDGMAALHSGLHNMAGGGIVAFADGGIPSYAKGDRVDSDLFTSVIAAESGGNPNAVSKKGAKGLAQLMPGTARDPGYGVKGTKDDSPEENKRVGKDYLNALIEKYGNLDYALAAYNWGPGNVDKWIENGADPKKLPKETREYIPKVKAGMAQMEDKVSMPGREQLAGLANLLPSAQAEEVKPRTKVSGPAQARAEAAKAAALAKPAVEEEASYDPMTGLKISGPEPKPYSSTVKPGTIVEPNPIRDLLQGTPRAATPQTALPPIATPSAPKPKDTIVNTLKPEVAPEKAPMGTPVPTAMDQLGNFQGAQMEVPTKKSLKDVMGEQAEADKAYGVDNAKMFDELRADYAKSGGDLNKRADKAAGMALVMFGVGLAGARKGQEWQTASESGKQALGMYMNSMERINDNEDRLKQRLQDLRVAENQYKSSRSDKALAALQSNRNEIKAIELENAKLKNQAMIKGAEFTVDIFKNENPAQYTVLKNIARDSGKTPAEIFMIANGVAKTNGMTLKDALEGVQRNMKYAGMTFPEQMQIAREGIGEGGGGLPKPKTAADAEKLPKGTQYQAPDGSIRTKQ